MMGIAPQTTNGGGGVAAPSFDFSSLLTVKSVEFTIADPRPPTADLVVKAPSWALPNASVVVTLTATSYLGTSVASAPITLDWSAGSAKGIVNTTTDSTGSATATIDLGKVPADSAPSSGEQLSVRAQWVGPTREVIARTATVSLQTSRRRLEVTRNLDTNTPGVAWGVKTTVTDTESGSELKGVPVLVSLQVKDAGTANCSTSAACNTSSGSPAEACQLMLPCTGKFELQACTTDEQQGGGVPACANVTLGHTWEYWTTHPLLAHDTPTLTANASSYAPGAVAGLSFQNPWPNASALMVWGNDLSSLSKQLSQVPSGLVTLALPLGPELSVDLTVQENRDLEVKLTIGQAGNSSTTGQTQTIVAPGAQTNISVAVSRQGQSLADAEVTLVAVDKAVLDLLPLPLAGLVPDLIVKLLPYLSEVNMGDAMVSPSALDEVLKSVRRRLALDPWISPDLAITPSKGLPSWQRGSGMASVDMNDTAFFQRLFTAITYGLGGPRLASSFQTTPLFTTLRTTADGQGIATFTAPANLGTFVVRAYAVSKGGQALGSAEGQLVVRRSVSITASLPRAVRINDTFQAGVLVTAPGYAGPGPLPVTVSVQVIPAASSDAVAQGPLQLLSQSATANVTLTPEATQQEVTVPVLAQQGAVILATSFALRPSNSSQGPSWQEGLVLPQAVPGSGALGLVAGVGYLPALQTAFQGILSQITARDPSDPSASLALVLALLPTTLATYSQNLTAEQAGNVTAAVTSLQQLTHSAYGLLPSLPGKWGWTPTWVDIQLNSWAAWLISGASQALDQAAVADPLLAGLVPGLNSLSRSTAARWKEAAVQQLLKDATELRKPPRNTLPPQNYSDWTTLAWVRADLSLPNLLAAVEPHDSASSAKLLTATALLATGNTSYSSFIASVADGLLSSIRVQAQTAYVAASKGAKRAAGLDIQALALGLLTALARPSEAVLLPKLALYVAQQGNTRLDLSAAYWPISPSTQAVGLSIRSLAAYDVTAGSASPDLQLEVAAGNTSLLQASFRSNSSTTASSTTPWSALASPPGPLSFQVQGRGEASLAASLNFVPALLLPYPTYRGLWLEAVVQATDPQTGQAVGPALAGAPLGALLMVTLQ
ncbi:A2M domain-containing protein, partial [Haematococcus lacustris]